MNGSSFSVIQPISRVDSAETLQSWEIATANDCSDLIALVCRVRGREPEGYVKRYGSSRFHRQLSRERVQSQFGVTHSSHWGLQPRNDVIRRSQIPISSLQLAKPDGTGIE